MRTYTLSIKQKDNIMTETIYINHNYSGQTKETTDKYYFNNTVLLEVSDSCSWPNKGDYVRINQKKFIVQSFCFDPINLINEIILEEIK